jgi:Domain of unknown function (DUF4224)
MRVFPEALRKSNEWLFDPEDRTAARRAAKHKRAARKHSPEDAITVSPSELKALTDRERPSAQARVLARLGIPHRRRPDGSLIVLRCHVSTVGPARAIVRASEPQLVL